MAGLPIEVNHLHKDEIIYELKFRGVGVEEARLVDELRKCLRPLIKLEKQSSSFSYPVVQIDVDDELKFIELKFGELETIISSPSRPQSCRSRIHHYINRVNRIKISQLNTDQVPKHARLLADFLTLLDSLDSDDLSTSLANVSIANATVSVTANNTPTIATTANTTVTNLTASPSAVVRSYSGKSAIAKWGIKFTGDVRDFSVHNFLERVTELRLARGVSEADLFESAIDLFDAKALLWYRSNRARFNDWQTLTDLLRKHYEPPDYKARLLQDILSRTQDSSESFVDYYSCMLSMFRRYGDASEEVQLGIISRNLAPFYTMQLPSVNNLSELEDECLKLEHKKYRADHYKPPVRKRNTYVEPDFAFVSAGVSEGEQTEVRVSAIASRRAAPDLKCYNCGQVGHKFDLCDKPRKRFCYRCGYADVTVRNCPGCSGNAKRGTRRAE